MKHHIFIVAGEHSGDQLGARLMETLKRGQGHEFQFSGIGGEGMERQGLQSLFPLSDVAVMGVTDIARQLPKLRRRVLQVVEHAVLENPDLVIIIDSPEFTHPIAKRFKAQSPQTPVIDYVSPSVWAWRPGRARKMTRYIDHVLALLPFEPGVHKKLGGPACSYVGHPLIERLGAIQQADHLVLASDLDLNPARQVLVVLPGSRPSEVKRLMAPFGETVEKALQAHGDLEVIIPVVSSVRHLVEEGLAGWPITPHLVEGEKAKFEAFKLAKAALAASGTVTLELALAGVPMVVGYKVDQVTYLARFIIKAPSAVLPNLILEKLVFPEFIQVDCIPEKMADALVPLLSDSSKRAEQVVGLDMIAEKMQLDEGSPSEAAAKVIQKYLL